MGSQEETAAENERTAEFTLGLLEEIETFFGEKDYISQLESEASSSRGCFCINIYYKKIYVPGQIVLARTNRKGEDHRLVIIDRPKEVQIMSESREVMASLPIQELRQVVQVYDDLTTFLQTKFGDPISEKENKTTYSTRIEDKLTESQ